MHIKQWIIIALLLFVYSVTAVDEYCIEKPWECCDGDSSKKPGKFLYLAISQYTVDLLTANVLLIRNHSCCMKIFKANTDN